MELNVATELKLAGRVSHASLAEEFPVTELNGRSIVLTEPVRVDLDYSFDGEGFTLKGRLSSAVRMNCTKCNEEFIEPFSVDFSERFLRISEQEAEELECYTYTGETLVLDKMVFDLILLNAPMYGLCRPGCKGLCPVCGANLNNTQCSCSEADESNPFAALLGLKELLNDD
ncbi:MAG: DUF177 domain-containing protein [Clostridiales bacterium]|nr:DUF177 domain-containing protein [Clostridiales bacterium]